MPSEEELDLDTVLAQLTPEQRQQPRVPLETYLALHEYTQALATARNAWRAAYANADQDTTMHRDIALEEDHHTEHLRLRFGRIKKRNLTP